MDRPGWPYGLFLRAYCQLLDPADGLTAHFAVHVLVIAHMQGPGQATGHTDGLQPGLAPVMAQITFAGLAGNGIQMGR